MPEFLYHGITQQILGAAFEVHGTLGYGFLEKVYQKAMFVELQLRGLNVESEAKLIIKYRDVVVGEYYADLLVEDCVLVELKVAEHYQVRDEAQLLNELRASGIKVGLLINFGKEKVGFKRLVV